MTGYAAIAVVIVLYSAFALRLDHWSISMPMTMTAAGFLLGPGGFGVIDVRLTPEIGKFLVELTLALLLFADASTLNLRGLEGDVELPLRLLGIGLPLMILVGTVAGVALFPGPGWAFAAMIAAILAPTDAALGLPIFTNAKLPVRIRRALNVESGLNDGIVTPFVSFFVATAVVAGEAGHHKWVEEALSEIILAVIAGVIIGVAGSVLIKQATARGWTSAGTTKIAVLGIALMSYFGSLAIHGNGFIAAFIAGIVFGAATKTKFAEPTDFTESFSTLLSLIVWMLFGAVVVHSAIDTTQDWRPIGYAILSLTAVRGVSVALSLLRTGFRHDTVLLMGWFGPRGLASIVFTLFAALNFKAAGESLSPLVQVAGWTILLSVLLHGVTARPMATWYSRRLESVSDDIPELRDLEELPARRAHVWTRTSN